jgi:methyl acetate hydrolase
LSTHADSPLSPWLKANPRPFFFDRKATFEDVLCLPLIYEPGTSYTYGIAIDWVDLLVTRSSGLSLEKYFQENIFAPSGATSFSFYPTDEVKQKKMWVCERDTEGKVVVLREGFGTGRPREVDQVPELLLGGAGLFGTQKDYLAVLRSVLQCDLHSPNKSSNPILSARSFAERFSPSLPVGEGYDGTAVLSICCARPQYFGYDPTPEMVNHSVGFLINLDDFPGRRNANSGCWSGAAKTQFWIDPKTGLAVSS